MLSTSLPVDLEIQLQDNRLKAKIKREVLGSVKWKIGASRLMVPPKCKEKNYI
jgi:hypothetical protein